MPHEYIGEPIYNEITEHVPIICVDLIIRARSNELLLVKRNNPPKKGEWWVPGGRVHKQETCLAAALRKAKEEIGINLMGAVAVGYYEDMFFGDDSPFEHPFHAISIVFEAKAMPGDIVLDDQSSEWKWSLYLPADFDYTGFGK